MERDLGYEGSYDTVKKYVAKIKKAPPKAYMVLNSFPFSGEFSLTLTFYFVSLKI